MLFVLGVGITGLSVFYLGSRLFSGELQSEASKRLEQGVRDTKSIILRVSRPLFRSLVLPHSSKLKFDDWRKKLKRTIISAGLEDEIDVDECLAFKIFLGFCVPLSLGLYFFATGSPLSLWVLIAMILGGFIYPSVWIGGTRSRRQEEIRIQLPFVIDLLTLATEAGLDFIGALQKVVEKTKSGPLVMEVERMLQQIQLGTTRADALRELSWRIDLQEISSLVAVLVTADQMGSPLGEVLRVQSDLIRSRRFMSAEKKGAAASQKLLFPLIFLIMPAVFIMIFGPVIMGFLGAN